MGRSSRFGTEINRPPVPTHPCCREEDPCAVKVVNLDFEARVPVPFSIFPRTYKEATEASAETKTTEVHEELEIKLPSKEKAGREGQYSSVSASAQLPPRRREERYSEEEVRITREEERYRRPGVHHHEYYEEHSHRPANANVFHETKNNYTQDNYSQDTFSQASRPQYQPQYAPSSYTESSVEVDYQHKPHYSAIDHIEREYRARIQPSYREEVHVTGTTVETPSHRPQFGDHVTVTGATVDTPSHIPHYAGKVSFTEETIDTPKATPSYHKDIKVTEETVEYPRHSSAYQKSKMGYYDEDGHYHSFRHGLHKVADRIFHPDSEGGRESHSAAPSPRPTGSSAIPNTVTIPCHHIRMGDILMLQGRPCQVIRISTSAATGQHRYLGVDLFSKQLHEESSFVSNPAPSVVVQTMLGPVFKQYRVLDIQNGSITAMTESGDVKTGLPVIDQSGLYSRLSSAFQKGHGSVRVLVLSDNGNELVVDVKVVHGSRL
ncbi:hypothetical protein E0Z10_g6124 [Xylaria hypoxylon]|uniref:Translation initiation factor 5A-like N-terminal domain-containing protein n=1 Tax=Xylaria hypoxylon TaxID=37992 RepID=A0A4Z0YU20_9PEZI|nr:hypothetical protein E0Z10_g6124 [Xylaria hypoxylon]